MGNWFPNTLGWNLARILKNLYRVNRERGSGRFGARKGFSYLDLSSLGSRNMFNKYINEKHESTQLTPTSPRASRSPSPPYTFPAQALVPLPEDALKIPIPGLPFLFFLSQKCWVVM